MVLDKRGMIFTTIAIALLSLFVVSYGAYNLIKDHSSENKRINTLNNFIVSIEKDMPRQLFISGYRSIFLFEKNILDTGNYIANTSYSFEEIFFNGTLDGVPQDLMEDATFSAMEGFLQSNADKINANIEILNPRVSLSHADPWTLKVAMNATVMVEDDGGLVRWNKTEHVEAYIPIQNFEDPIYSVNTQGKVSNKFNQTPYSIFVSGSDYSNLISHFENSYYKTSTSAPSFLKRLQGNLAASEYGIESIVNPEEISDAGISVKYKSLIDYIYFSTSNNPDAYTIPSVENLILDDEDNHLEIYNVSGVAVPV